MMPLAVSDDLGRTTGGQCMGATRVVPDGSIKSVGRVDPNLNDPTGADVATLPNLLGFSGGRCFEPARDTKITAVELDGVGGLKKVGSGKSLAIVNLAGNCGGVAGPADCFSCPTVIEGGGIGGSELAIPNTQLVNQAVEVLRSAIETGADDKVAVSLTVTGSVAHATRRGSARDSSAVDIELGTSVVAVLVSVSNL